MKTFVTFCGALGISCLLLLAARNLQATAIPEVTPTSGGSVARSSTVVAFNGYARTKVVQYFDTYRTDPMGLPPGWAARINANKIPAAWENSRIAPGVVVQESDRSYLMELPPELVRVLPAHSQDFRYYVAGCHLVAVNKDYKIVDSVRIPTIRLLGGDDRDQQVQLVRHFGTRYR